MVQPLFTKDGTAQGVAKQRFIESLAPHGQRVIFDPDAKNFIAGSRFIRLMGHRLNLWLSTKLAPGMHEHLIARTRFIDELVARCAAEGIEQYVILGAGYDLRAHRLALPAELAVFEVDQKEVQARKRSKLPEARASQSRPTYVSVDFSSQSLSQRLLDSGFDQTKSTLFTLEGVSQYVSKEALKKTLSELKILSAKPNTVFFVSYVDERINTDPAACCGEGYPEPHKKLALIQKLSAMAGESWQSFYSRSEFKALLADAGFAITEEKTLTDLNDEYFAPANRLIPQSNLLKLERLIVGKNTNLTCREIT